MSSFSRDDTFRSIVPWSGRAAAGFDMNFLGQRTDVQFNKGWADAERMTERDTWPPLPPYSEETIEWDALLSAVREAREQFVMVEAGAGYGRWSMAAACAIRMLQPGVRPRFVCIEAEPRHFAWLEQHFRDNDIDPRQHRLLCCAIAATEGAADFVTDDDPTAWYGQTMRQYFGAVEKQKILRVRTLPLSIILDGIDRVDLLDADIQGAELEVFPSAMATMNAKVKRAYIATHFGAHVDRPIYEAFASHGWQCVAHVPQGTTEQGANGPIYFEEGAQHWINPRL
jgi:FkbM family methyltransferase